MQVFGLPKLVFKLTHTVWENPIEFDRDAAQNWFVSFWYVCGLEQQVHVCSNDTSMSLHIAAFAYTGVEIVAASALEVKWPHKDKKDDRVATDFSQRSEQSLLVGKTVKFSSVYISFLATIAYTVAGTLASSNMHRSDCSLPRLSWLTSSECPEHLRESKGFTKSVFVAIAKESGIPHLANAFNVFLIFTAITCACTNLFVSSRSLFGVTTRLDGGPGQPGLLRLLAFFGRTNRNKVPLRAMIFSAVAFWWVPFLELKGGNGVGMVSINYYYNMCY